MQRSQPSLADLVTIKVSDTQSVSALVLQPPAARACLVLGHGAGAGMTHVFMTEVAAGLAERHIMTLRYQFPFMERGARRPDPPGLAQATVRAACAAAASIAPALPLVAGGKSFGGRMTSQAQAAAPLPGVGGLVFFGFPLHPGGEPSRARADHLAGIQLPMLFLQGTRDTLAEIGLMASVIESLGPTATVHVIDGADHAFKVPARSGRTGAQVLAGMLDAVAAWLPRAQAPS